MDIYIWCHESTIHVSFDTLIFIYISSKRNTYTSTTSSLSAIDTYWHNGMKSEKKNAEKSFQ